MEMKCSCENSCIINSKNIKKSLLANEPCPKCKNIDIKKFTPISEQFSLDNIDEEFGKCDCGKRPLDAVMSHVLKIILDLDIDIGKDTLRNGCIPLVTPFYTSKNPPFINDNSLIILHEKLDKNSAKHILKNVKEVKGVLKGNSNDTVGIQDLNSKTITYELLSGCDIKCDIIKTPIDTIVINKIQHLSYLEFPKSIENKIMKLCNYFKSKQLSHEEISKLTILDGTCGNGSLGIFLLKYGVGKVIFNDIWKPAIISSIMNLQSNGFRVKTMNKNFNSFNIRNQNINDLIKINNEKIAIGENFDIYNLAIEDLKEQLIENLDGKIDIFILDCFPGVETSNFEKIAKSIAKELWII